MIITGRERTYLQIHLWSSTMRGLFAKSLSFTLDKISSFQKTFPTILQFLGLLLQWIRALLLLDCTLKIRSGTGNSIINKLKFQRRSANRRSWCSWYLSPVCYDNENNELSKPVPNNSYWQSRIPLSTSVWFDFNARRYWKPPLTRASRRTPETVAKTYILSGTRYWNPCFGRTNVFNCSCRVWHCWQDYLKWISLLSGRKSTKSFYPSMGSVVHSLQKMF